MRREPASCSSPTSTRRAATRARTARPRWRSGCGGWATEVTVLTTSAYGSQSDDEENGVRPNAGRAASGAPACAARTGSTPCSTPTPTRAAPPAEQGDRARAAGAGLGPVRALAGAALNRRQRFDCVITTSPPESTHAVGMALARRGAALGGRHPRRVDLRAPAAAVPDRGAAPARRAPRAPLAGRRRRRGLRRRARRRGPARSGSASRAAPDPQRLGPGAGDRGDPAGGATEMLDPERTSLVYTGRFGSYGRDPAPLVEALGELAPQRPRCGLAPRAGGRRPADRGRGDAAASRRRSLADRRRRQPRARARPRAATRRRRPAAARITRPQPARQLQALRVPGRRAGRSWRSPPAPRPGGSSRRAAARPCPPTTWRRSPPRCAGSQPGSLRHQGGTSAEAYSYPAVAERMAEAAERAAELSRRRGRR